MSVGAEIDLEPYDGSYAVRLRGDLYCAMGAIRSAAERWAAANGVPLGSVNLLLEHWGRANYWLGHYGGYIAGKEEAKNG